MLWLRLVLVLLRPRNTLKGLSMKRTDLFPSTFLKAQDVTDAGGEMAPKIANIEMKEFENDEGRKEQKAIIVFENDKRMVCNKTNASALFSALGEDADMWIGKEVILVVQEVTFGNKTVPARRIKNLNSRDALIQAYWSKTRELGMTNPEGLAHLKQSSGDFQDALDGLVNPF